MTRYYYLLLFLSVFVFNRAQAGPASFTVNAGNDTTICANQGIVLNGSVQPAGNYSYHWSPGAGLSDSTLLNPIATVTATTVYNLTVTDGGGNTVTSSVTITTSGIAIPVNITDTPGVVCPGQQLQLSANILPTVCGVSTPCGGSILSGVIGAGITAQPGTGYDPTTPTLLGNLQASGRNQMLYTAAELNTALGSASTIKVISFNIAVFNSNNYLQSFVISVACTNQTSLSTFDNNLTQVYSVAQMQPVNGWNNFNLNNAFNWDGHSNLIVDVCWYDPVTYGNQNNKAQCTLLGTNSYLWLNGTTDLCGTNAAPNISTLRPNLRFNYCVPDINNYTINWTPNTGANAVSNPAIANPTANPVVSTNYTVTVGTGVCPGAQTVTVQVDNSSVEAGPDINACPGNNTTLTATAVGTPIPGPAVFSWSVVGGGPVGTTVSPTVTTSYVVKMTGGACPKYDTMTINVGSLTVTPTPTNVSCFNAHDGQINATANGTSPYHYTWSANAATGNANPATGLGPGSYQVTMSDVSGCTGSATATITQPTQVTFTSGISNDSCFGGSDGKVTINPSGGIGGYTYQWSNGLPPNNPAINLQANTYTVTVKDAGNCTASASVTITQPTAITFGTPSIVAVKCFGASTGQITVTPSGGTGAYSYSWSQNPALNSPTAQNLATGSYTVTVKDAYNCTVAANNQVSQPASALSVPAPVFVSPTCFGGNNGSATASPVGGGLPYSYLWSPSGQNTATANGLSAQTYTVTVTDDSLCTASASVNVSQPLQIIVSGTVTNVLCHSDATGSINTTVTNGVPAFGFRWSNGDLTQNISGLVANNYTVTVTDVNNCTGTKVFTVTEPPVLVLNAPTIVQVTCLGGTNGSITANPAGGAGGYGYAWNLPGTGPSLNNLAAGNYSVTVTDANNCTVSAAYAVTQPASALGLDAPVVTPVLCNGASTGAITENANGGTPAYNYAWSPNSSTTGPIAGSLAAGTYSVTVTDANTCRISASFTVSQPPPIIFGPAVITNVTCAGKSDGTASISPTGGTGVFSYTWNGLPGTNSQINLAANNYLVVVTDANNCTADTTLTITEPAPFLDSAVVIQNDRCFQSNDGAITVIPTGGNTPFSYSWSNAQTAQTANHLAAGAYSCTVTDNTGCTFTISGAVSQPPILGTGSKIATAVKCVGDKNGTITATGTGGIPPYDYSVTQDGANFVYATNGVVVGLDTGLYTIVLSDSNGCTKEDTIRVNNAIPDSFTVTTDSTSCFGKQYADGAIHVNGLTMDNMPYQYSVDSGLFQFAPDFFGQAAGLHHITGENNFGCLTYLTAIVGEPVNGIATVMPKDTTLKLGASIQLYTSFGPYPPSSIVGYSWTPSIGLSCIDCPSPVVTPYSRETQYFVTITYNNHCEAGDSMTIIIENNLKVFIPNSFSPNGDGNNDLFLIYGEGIKTIVLRVFNRWGEMVFQTDNQFEGWDGTFKGQLQNPGVFVYDAQITYLDDKKAHRTGSITLIR